MNVLYKVSLSWQLQTVWEFGFSYFDALSVSLQKLKPEIVNGLENHGLSVENVILHTTVSDGCDGIGEISIYKENDF